VAAFCWREQVGDAANGLPQVIEIAVMAGTSAGMAGRVVY
jgi:hypothetical protein